MNKNMILLITIFSLWFLMIVTNRNVSEESKSAKEGNNSSGAVGKTPTVREDNPLNKRFGGVVW